MNGCHTLNIDILVGGDYYWQFFSGKIVRGIAGPVAMETSLGWVLSGSVPNNSTNTNVLIATHVMKVKLNPLALILLHNLPRITRTFVNSNHFHRSLGGSSYREYTVHIKFFLTPFNGLSIWYFLFIQNHI